MQFYLASRWENKKVLGEHRKRIQELGHTVCARWLDSDGQRPKVNSPEWSSYAEYWQAINLEDIDACEVMLVDLSCDMRWSTGGTFVEFGYALRAHKEIWVVGHRPNVFFQNPELMFYPNWDKVYRALGAPESLVAEVSKSEILYSLESNLETLGHQPPNTLVQVPQIVHCTNAWGCLDADQIYADPGMKILRKI